MIEKSRRLVAKYRAGVALDELLRIVDPALLDDFVRSTSPLAS
jgi:hypothetical protein